MQGGTECKITPRTLSRWESYPTTARIKCQAAHFTHFHQTGIFRGDAERRTLFGPGPAQSAGEENTCVTHLSLCGRFPPSGMTVCRNAWEYDPASSDRRRHWAPQCFTSRRIKGPVAICEPWGIKPAEEFSAERSLECFIESGDDAFPSSRAITNWSGRPPSSRFRHQVGTGCGPICGTVVPYTITALPVA